MFLAVNFRKFLKNRNIINALKASGTVYEIHIRVKIHKMGLKF